MANETPHAALFNGSRRLAAIKRKKKCSVAPCGRRTGDNASDKPQRYRENAADKPRRYTAFQRRLGKIEVA